MKRSKKGFTLIELLIVIAIIAILAAIAIPTFTAQLNKANAAVDQANLRAATSLAVADYMLDGGTGTVYYTAIKAAGSGSDATLEVKTVATAGAAPTSPDVAYPSSVTPGSFIQITIADGVATTATWSTVTP